jgi:hypothetical protein
MVVVDINEANFHQIAEFSTLAILGKRRSGKTTWATSLIQFLVGKCEKFVVHCGNKDNMTEWRKVVPPGYVHIKNVAHLKKLRNHQDTTCSVYSEQQRTIPLEDRVTLILDDCGSDTKFMHSDVMKDLLSNGRHYGLYIIILVQYLNQMHAVNRDQLDYVGVLHTTNSRNIDKLFNEYCNVCDKLVFAAILKALTCNRGLCWIDNTVSSAKINESLFYKEFEQMPTSGPVGGSTFRQYSDARYNSETVQTLLAKLTREGKLELGAFGLDTDGETADLPPKQITVRKNKSKNDAALSLAKC